MTSCERAPLIHPQEPQTSQSPRADPAAVSPITSRYVSRADVPHVMQKLKPYFKEYRLRHAESILDIDSTHVDRLKVVEATDSAYTRLPFKVYSMYVGSDIPNTLFNVNIEEYADSSMSEPYVLMYHMDSTFASAYFEGRIEMDGFKGTLSKHEMSVMFGGYGVHQRGVDLEIIVYCWKKVFGGPPASGGPTIGTFPTGGNITYPFPTGPIFWHPTAGTPCTWRIGLITGTLYIECQGGGKPGGITLWEGSDSTNTESRTDYTFEECYRILIMSGIIDERPG